MDALDRSGSAESAVGFLPTGDQLSPQPCPLRSTGRQAAPTLLTCQQSQSYQTRHISWKTASHKRAKAQITDKQCPAWKASARLHQDTIAALRIPLIPRSRPRSTPIIYSHNIYRKIKSEHYLFVRRSVRVRFKIRRDQQFAGQPPQSSSRLVSQKRSSSTVVSQECAWVRRRTQDLPSTKETAHRKNPARDAPALTRRETQFQEARSPLRESSKFATDRHSSSAARLHSQSFTADPNSRRPTEQRSRHQRDHFRCAQCGADPEACTGSTDSGLMEHMGISKVTQLRQLDRAACVICGTVRSRRGNR